MQIYKNIIKKKNCIRRDANVHPTICFVFCFLVLNNIEVLCEFIFFYQRTSIIGQDLNYLSLFFLTRQTIITIHHHSLPVLVNLNIG